MKTKAIYLILSTILFTNSAMAAELCGTKTQGEIMLGHAQDAKKITFNGKNISLSPTGDFLIAFGRDQKTEQALTIDGQKHTFDITKRKWDVQSIKGLPPKTVNPSETDQKEIDRERSDLRQALIKITPDAFWQNGFIKPIEGRTSGNFGNQRIMNGSPKSPHQGMDIAAAEGTPVVASGDGIIRLADFDYFYTGNVIVIDHGYNLTTIYAHMKDISVKNGDTVKQGDKIGTVGKTGRATGAHLHWGASLNGNRFDPVSLLSLKDDKKCFQLP